MGDKSRIEWTDATWNPTSGCSKVSQGCKNCYAKRDWKRLSAPGQPYAGRAFEDVALHPERLEQPLRWRRPRRIFVDSMSDLFHEAVPDEFIAAVFGVMASSPLHTFQILTKRPERMREWFEWLAREASGANERYMNSPSHRAGVEARQKLRDEGKPSLDEPPPPTEIVRGLYDIAEPIVNAQLDPTARRRRRQELPVHHWCEWPLENVWIGVSCEDQATVDERVHHLRMTPAAVRFISAEPLLGPIDLTRVNHAGAVAVDALRGTRVDPEPIDEETLTPINWVIVGGESGPNARPMHPLWASDLRDQCASAGVPFTFKQWGEWAPRGDFLEGVGRLQEIDPQCKRWSEVVRLTESGGNGNRCEDRDGGEDRFMQKVGKKMAGRLLEGVEHDDAPSPVRLRRGTAQPRGRSMERETDEGCRP